MYRIFVGKSELVLTHSNLISEFSLAQSTMIFRYNNKKKHFFQCIDLLEKSLDSKRIVLYSKDLKKMYIDFKEQFPIYKAAGGLVVNDNAEILVMKKRGYWDLPKGKKEAGESKKQTARREVMEETGVKDLLVANKLATTFHLFRLNGSDKRVVKRSDWYLMFSQQSKLIPQAEEQIESLEWVNIRAFLQKYDHEVFTNIRIVMEEYLSLLDNSDL